MRRHVRNIRFAPPIAAGMTVVAGIARLFGVKIAPAPLEPAHRRAAALD
jgi:hypothetical protein